MNFIDRWIVERQIARAKKRPRQGFKPSTFQGGSLFMFVPSAGGGGGGGGGGLGITLFDSLVNNALVVTGTVETQFYSKSIPGNTVVAGKGLRIIHQLIVVDTAGVSPVENIKIKMDGVLQFTVQIRGSETVNIGGDIIVVHSLFPYTAGGNNQTWDAFALAAKDNVLDPAFRAAFNALNSTFDMTLTHVLSATIQNPGATTTAYHRYTTMEILQA